MRINHRFYPIAEVWGDKEATLLVQFTNTMIDLDYENSKKMNYLHLATERNHTYFLDVLLQLAQDSNKLEELIESRDKVGNTPYHYAAMKMNPKYNIIERYLFMK